MRDLRNLFLGVAMSALSPAPVQAEPYIDVFLCVLEAEEGPSALFQTSISMGDETNLNYLGRTQEFYGSAILTGNLYTRKGDRLELSVDAYQSMIKQGNITFTTPETLEAQLDEWKKARDAIQSGTSRCLSM